MWSGAPRVAERLELERQATLDGHVPRDLEAGVNSGGAQGPHPLRVRRLPPTTGRFGGMDNIWQQYGDTNQAYGNVTYTPGIDLTLSPGNDLTQFQDPAVVHGPGPIIQGDPTATSTPEVNVSGKIARPIGRDRAKKQRSNNSSSSSACFEMLQKIQLDRSRFEEDMKAASKYESEEMAVRLVDELLSMKLRCCVSISVQWMNC
ncbi:hypothetical protein Zm00014a_018588 [Zea mays]|uniref:No apical meristem-associated C-terminal domain-containing protein n=1 Tax=Zea mays TaxID=4577 RepID=A0A317YFG9_MAIZE|nr:hypothetical protein Zm00014a_018588 [Zea mays]